MLRSPRGFSALAKDYDVDVVVLAMSSAVLQHCPHVNRVYRLPQSAIP